MDTKDDFKNSYVRDKFSEHRRNWQHCGEGDRHSDKRLWLGIGIILLGIVILSRNMNILSYELQRYIFTWEVILIVIGLFMTLGKRNWSAGIIMITVGSLFYLKNVLNLIDFNFWTVFWPGMLILAGVMIILRHHFDKQPEKKMILDNDNIIDEVAVFGGGDRVVASQAFQGGKVTTVFGGLNFDMLKTKLAPGENVIDVFCLFGGMKLIVPEGWTIKIRVMSLFGGFTDKHRFRVSDNNAQKDSVLIIKGIVIFGGGEIKSYLD